MKTAAKAPSAIDAARDMIARRDDLAGWKVLPYNSIHDETCSLCNRPMATKYFSQTFVVEHERTGRRLTLGRGCIDTFLKAVRRWQAMELAHVCSTCGVQHPAIPPSRMCESSDPTDRKHTARMVRFALHDLAMIDPDAKAAVA